MEVLCWIDRVLSSNECVCCVCNPSMSLDVPFTGLFMCVCVCVTEVISSFRSLRAGSQVFALLVLFLV